MISTDPLKNNMICITFGQPNVDVEIIRNMARRRRDIITTIHAIFIAEDHIPSLMRFLDECWSAKVDPTQTEDVHGAQAPAPSMLQSMVGLYMLAII